MKFIYAAEEWTRKNLKDDAETAETVRTNIKKQIKEKDIIDVDLLPKEIFKEQSYADSFCEFLESQGINEAFDVDKNWVEKKLKKKKLKIGRDIDLYIDEETYKDSERFEIIKNGDGSISILLKNIRNYIEK